ncbi:MAG: AAA family ATPase [Candidatus Nomurabacteria bacterium]|jgi:ATP-dependent exoDNAse (exonuclease V) alpha subunit|nr:AAA family ATPase [Candidatus Nomurabacteria bacterium]
MKQAESLGVMLSGRNCFLTGAAGAGKTYVLNQFIRASKARGRKVAVTASTGIAATHLNGNTIHSWSGIGTREDLNRWFFDKLPKTRRTTIENTEILIIDEISMLHSYYLDLVDQVCRRVRGELLKPFGGIQVIVCGDFFQLPPISRDRVANFAYDALVWKEADFQTLYLTEQHRQDDSEYLEILNAIRSGDYRKHHISSLMNRINAELSGELTELHTHNSAVDNVNHQKLKNVRGSEQSFSAEHHGNRTYWEKLLNSILAPETLKLKVGALVMSVKNVPEKGFWNGSIGKVIDFGFDGYPIVEFKNGRTIKVAPEEWNMIDGETNRATVSQVPLRLAWAITIHKSQGMTMDSAKIDLRRAFEPGMGYVALSRVKSLTGLSLIGINRQAILVNQEVLARDAVFRQDSAKLSANLDPKILELAKTALAPKKTPQESQKSQEPANLDPEAEKKLQAKTKWAERVAKERAKWPNARKSWTIGDSILLIEQYLKGKTVDELVVQFGRKPRSIMMRINESFGAEIFTDEDGI